MIMDAKTFVSQVGKLPSLPSVFYDLARAVDDPNSSIEQIGAIVRNDQSLASRLLKLSNSAMYSFPSQVETIEEALQIIGLREMRDLALATCVINTFRKFSASMVDMLSFWKHSIACGLASALLAEERHEPASGRFFVGGLLHDIGRLLLYLKAPAELERIIRRYETDNISLCRVEFLEMGFDHAELGAELISNWKLPLPLINMVRQHHSPSKIRTPTLDEATIHYADFIVTALDYGDSGETTVSPVSEEACSRCLLDESRIESLTEELMIRCNKIFPILTKE